MSINFHDGQNRLTYAAREADPSWLACIRSHANVKERAVVDIGCGGGIYSKALLGLGARQVTGVDFSLEMLSGAAEHCKDVAHVQFAQGHAYNTGLPSGCADVVLERALIHHLDDLDACFQEAGRVLNDSGMLIVQDRTSEDCLLAGDDRHIRGYFFEKYPRLIETETARRFDSKIVREALSRQGFRVASEVQLWETRRGYDSFAELSEDLMKRTGRSLLHALSDEELQELTAYIKDRWSGNVPIVEQDRWTLWFCVKN